MNECMYENTASWRGYSSSTILLFLETLLLWSDTSFYCLQIPKKLFTLKAKKSSTMMKNIKLIRKQ